MTSAAESLAVEISDAWRALGDYGYPPEAVGCGCRRRSPPRSIASLASATNLLAEVLVLRERNGNAESNLAAAGAGARVESENERSASQ